MASNEPILCYVEERCAYFTTQSLEDQWGDDWNDAPYEFNAGRPYFPREIDDWEITEVFYSINWVDYPSIDPEIYSVEDINNKKVPWLRIDPDGKETTIVSIWAGTPISEFKRIIKECGGRIWVEEKE